MKTILLIEDDLNIRETTSEMLRLADYHVLSAEDGKTGIELAKSKRPDLIICDIMMPNLNGYGVLSILNRNPETYHIPLIFLTAKANNSDFRKGMNLGADDYITKPFQETELLTAIETRIKRSENLKLNSALKVSKFNEFINETNGLDQLKDLPKNKKVRVYKKKETIYREDDFANYIYFILKGKVKCVKTDYYGKYFVNNLYGSGDFFGYTSLLNEKEYKETVIAIDDTQIAIIPKHEFLTLLEKNRDVSKKFIQILSVNIEDKENRLLQLAYAPLRERLASALLRLRTKDGDGDEVNSLTISREDLASIVGTAKESLIRTLSELKKEGLVETDGQKIKILNEAGLRNTTVGFTKST